MPACKRKPDPKGKKDDCENQFPIQENDFMMENESEESEYMEENGDSEESTDSGGARDVEGSGELDRNEESGAYGYDITESEDDADIDALINEHKPTQDDLDTVIDGTTDDPHYIAIAKKLNIGPHAAKKSAQSEATSTGFEKQASTLAKVPETESLFSHSDADNFSTYEPRCNSAAESAGQFLETVTYDDFGLRVSNESIHFSRDGNVSEPNPISLTDNVVFQIHQGTINNVCFMDQDVASNVVIETDQDTTNNDISGIDHDTTNSNVPRIDPDTANNDFSESNQNSMNEDQ